MQHDIRAGGSPQWREVPLHTVAATCGILKVSPPTAYKMGRDGRLAFKRLGNRTMVTTASIIEYLASAQDWTPSTRATAARQAKLRVVQ
ncbi:helix-turn-helix domain-containing protein [Devosia alba]|uniref:helix-turn-helix domain-containing protein n=1 Tax=Devosia alba TaxID=3152360 RepID=UPI003265C0E5